jgi:hypothetical protein
VVGFPGQGADGSEAGEALGGVAATIELDAHPVHDPEIHAAEVGAFVPDPTVVEHAAGPGSE